MSNEEFLHSMDENLESIQELKGQIEILEAYEDATRFHDYTKLAGFVEAGDTRVLNCVAGQKLIAMILRGELKSKRGVSGREQKRKTERDRFIIQSINVAIGAGGSPVWSTDDPGICGMVSELLLERGLKPMEPEAIYRHVWSKRKKETNDQQAWRLLGEIVAAADKRVEKLEASIKKDIKEAVDE